MVGLSTHVHTLTIGQKGKAIYTPGTKTLIDE